MGPQDLWAWRGITGPTSVPCEMRGVSLILILALGAQLVALVFWGHAVYLWVQGIEAVVAAVPLTIYARRFRTYDPRPSKWPPLLPLAFIGAAGGVKDFYVVTRPETPAWVAVWLLASVAWFVIASFAMWRAEHRGTHTARPS